MVKVHKILRELVYWGPPGMPPRTPVGSPDRWMSPPTTLAPSDQMMRYELVDLIFFEKPIENNAQRIKCGTK